MTTSLYQDRAKLENINIEDSEWSAAAFDRDRRTGRETDDPEGGGRNYPVESEEWRDKKPLPVPSVRGDGDLTLYRILRDEEPGIPLGS